MNSIKVAENKSLKLINVLERELDMTLLENSSIEAQKMENYVRNKGTKVIGPLIQYVAAKEEGKKADVRVVLMRQCGTPIHSVEKPYRMKPEIRVKNCLYCRYTGPEEKIKFAYDKLYLLAFEEEISLTGTSYTIFVGQDEQNDVITADVFMERADGATN